MGEVERRGDLLVVDDEASILDVVSAALRQAGFAVTEASTGMEAIRAARATRFDLIVLDVMLPDHDGFEVCRRLQAEGIDTPILFLTARTESTDAARGLALGGDDYVRKPFQLDELLARVKALLRRTIGPDPEDEILNYQDLRVDLRSFEASRSDRSLGLTPLEFRLLVILVQHGGRILTRAQLLDLVWDDPWKVDTAAVETVISRLRRKLDVAGEPPLLTTRRGIGYGIIQSAHSTRQL